MKLKVLFPFLLVVFSLILSPVIISAADVPWSSEEYSVVAGYEFGAAFNADYDSGPSIPVSASINESAPCGPGGGPSDGSFIIDSSITTSAMNVSTEFNGYPCVGTTVYAEAEFTGVYTASTPYLMFSYNVNDIGATSNPLITMIKDLNDGSILFFQSGNPETSNSLYIPTPIGHNINVRQILGSGLASPGASSYSVSYDMAVVPEPISSTLFIIGGATLGFRRFRKRK